MTVHTGYRGKLLDYCDSAKRGLAHEKPLNTILGAGPTHLLLLLLLLLVGGAPRLSVLVVALAAAPGHGSLSAKQGFELHHLATAHYRNIATCATPRTTDPTDPLTPTRVRVPALHATSGWLSIAVLPRGPLW